MFTFDELAELAYELDLPFDCTHDHGDPVVTIGGVTFMPSEETYWQYVISDRCPYYIVESGSL